MTILFQRTLEQGSGKLCTCYVLEQGQRRRRYNSFDNARTMNCSLNNNTNHDPVTKSGSTIQPLQKHGLFHKIHMFWDSVMLMKIPPRSQKVSIINIDYVSSLKKMSASWSGQVKRSRSNKWGDRKSLDKGRGTFEDFELFGYHSCKNLCCELERFHSITAWWFYLLLRCYKLADRRLCTILSLVETTSPSCWAKYFSVMAT